MKDRTLVAVSLSIASAIYGGSWIVSGDATLTSPVCPSWSVSRCGMRMIVCDGGEFASIQRVEATAAANAIRRGSDPRAAVEAALSECREREVDK